MATCVLLGVRGVVVVVVVRLRPAAAADDEADADGAAEEAEVESEASSLAQNYLSSVSPFALPLLVAATCCGRIAGFSCSASATP